MKRRHPLGRGLESLIPGASGEERLIEIPTDRIRPNPYQTRREFKEEELNSLASSIRNKGLLQPIIVRELDEGEYELVVGERRLRACKLAGIESIPAIKLRIIDERDMLALALVENLQREELNPIEEAEGYKLLAERFGLSQQGIAYLVGKSRTAVANIIRLLKLSEPVKELIRQGKLTEGHGRALLAVSDPELQYKIASVVARKKLSVERTELLTGSSTRALARRKRAASAKPAFWAGIEQELCLSLGTKVTLMKKGKEGRIVISFYSDEELQRLFELLISLETPQKRKP